MVKLKELRYGEVVKRLRKFGFRFYRHGQGSHELWVRDTDGRVVPVPRHKGKTVRKGTLRAIIREIGVSTDEFMKT
ncbi:type II toxin-antitoxin system HicA family toxin [Desulfonema magnum]|uniref:Toxin-antitoxin system, toxin component, HicA domain-containing protein n=1 Tax=Desulfonema magnum TaxID=45655 RepID=A0A975BSG9_9BACT|nr:type II toxin-antitoxin system HicA family toxin [Desulfonema magnum]QTA90617.1 Toxin-antitoxin system, toxin component, HicA domain-containing protein [Desulfonema magnum]